MKNIFNIKTLFFVALTSLVLTSCSDDDYQKEVVDNTVALSEGTADFSNYVAIGNSLTAGFTDGALFKAGQENSIPNLTANKFALAGGGDFTQPLMNDNIGGFLNTDADGNFIQNPRYYFYSDTNPEEPNLSGPMLLGTTPYDSPMIPTTPTTDVTNITSGPYNNMGVPGAKSYHLGFNGYGNMAGLGVYANPYFVRMASSPAASVMDDVTSQNPTFFSLWVGANDVLRYSLAGGDGVDQTGNSNPTTYADADITDPNYFAFAYNGLVDALTENGAKGVVLNIPDITVIPYFTTVPYAPLDPTNEDFAAQIPALNGFYNSLNGAFAYLGVPERSVVFSSSEASPVVIHDESLTNISSDLTAVLQNNGVPATTAYLLGIQFGQSRQATAEDLLVLPSKSAIGKLDQAHFEALVAMGVPEADAGQLSMAGLTYPLVDKYVLIPSEQEAVQTATEAYNSTIESIATAKDLAFVDVRLMMNQLASGGIIFDGFTMTNQYIFGGTFSLDGVHPTARGNAFISNEILKAIDAKYGSTFEASGNLNKATDFVTQYPATLQ